MGSSVIVLAMCLALVAKAEEFIFSNFNSISDLETTGYAHPKDSELWLTDYNFSSHGAFCYKSPIRLCDPSSEYRASFTTSFTFKVEKSDPTQVKNADGLAFTISPDKLAVSPHTYGRWLGVFSPETNGNDSNKIVAVEFDTYLNLPNDYPEFYDIDDNHVGIDIHSVRSANMSSLYPAGVVIGSAQTVAAKIDYDANEQRLRVYVSYDTSFREMGNPVLEHSFELCAYVAGYSFVGFSAGSGNANLDYHKILSWNFSATAAANNNTPSDTLNLKLVAGIVVPAGVLALGAGAVATWVLLKRKRKPKADLVRQAHEISYADLAAATDNFSELNLLGQGGFGSVFRGRLPTDKSLVAVKKMSETSRQGEREFLAEVTIIGQLSHRNLVKLRGWCTHKKQLIVVYDYMPGGSVDKLLFESEASLLWETRHRILCGIAAALVYIHEDWENQVVHRDVKLSNVLLDYNSNARLGDFGLARMAEHGLKLSTTSFAGTMGYLAPEVAMATRFTAASDTFSFGIVVLEMVTGMRAIAQEGLLPWVEKCISEGKVSEVIDSRLRECDHDQAYQALGIGLSCAAREAESRPTMKQVLESLHKTTDVLESLCIAIAGSYEENHSTAC